MKYYTTRDQERLICKDYELAIEKKQKELDEKERTTGKIQKYSASFYIDRPSRVFICENGQVYMKFGRKKLMCPNEEVEGGCAYFVDPDFADKFEKFVNECGGRYTIEFRLDNGSVRYCGGPNVYSSTIRSIEDLDVHEVFEDEEKFDLVCG